MFHLNTKQIEDRFNKAIADARVITTQADREGRGLTSSERTKVEGYIQAAAALKDLLGEAQRSDVRDSLARLSGGGSGSGDLYGAFRAAGWEPGNGKKVTIPATVAYGQKVSSFDSGDLAAWTAPRFEGVPLAADRRKVFQIFPVTAVDAATTSVQVFRQQSRTLATSDLVHRAIDSAATKPETSSALELITASMEMLATVQSGVPNIHLIQEGVRPILNQDMQLALERGLEDMCIDAINTANPSTSGTTDLTTAAVTARNAIAVDGYAASVIVLAPADYAVALLKRGTSEVWARPDPLTAFELVPVATLAAGTAYLLDPASAGRLFLSGLTLASFEENSGKSNTTTLRLEGSAYFNVERVAAIRKLGSVA